MISTVELDGEVHQVEDESKSEKEDEEEETEEDSEIFSEENSEFSEEMFEDATVFPKYMDEIIRAYVRKCIETLKQDKKKEKAIVNEEFPSLNACTVPTPRDPALKTFASAVAKTSFGRQSCDADYEIRYSYRDNSSSSSSSSSSSNNNNKY